MRCILCVLSVCWMVGCRNQTTPLTNPFLTSDRVPPPATRVLQPGTAQPYYPGDPVPTLPPAGFPTQNFSPTPAPSGSAYPPGQPIPRGVYGTPQPTTPTTPPGGWNNNPAPLPGSSSRNPAANQYIQPSSAEFPLNTADRSFASDQVVRIQGDQQNLRFAPAPLLTVAAPIPTDPYFAAQQPIVQQPVQLPVQSILPRQQVRIREISSGELSRTQPTPRFSTSPRTQDGFRPQGSFENDRRAALRGAPGNPRSAITPTGHVAQIDNTGRFGFDPNYQWLRGQLEYLPTGQWKLRYTPIQGTSAGRPTDPLGGSVVIENPHLLGNLRPGDFVQVRGNLRSQPPSNNAFAPIYALTVVQRQRQ